MRLVILRASSLMRGGWAATLIARKRAKMVSVIFVFIMVLI
jgi:hypothetical protein